MLGKIIGLIEESIKLFFFFITHSDVTDSLDKAEVALQNYETRKAQNAPEATLTELSRALRNSLRSIEWDVEDLQVCMTESFVNFGWQMATNKAIAWTKPIIGSDTDWISAHDDHNPTHIFKKLRQTFQSNN